MGKMLKKGMCLAVAVTFLLGAVAGCGQKEGTDSTQTSGTSTAAVKTEETAKPRGTVTLEMTTVGYGTKLPSGDADFIKAEIKKALDIDLVTNVTDGMDDYVSQLNVRLASGSAPDLFQIKDRTNFLKYASDKMLFDLTPSLDSLKDYAAFVGENNLKKAYYDGKMFAITKPTPANYTSLLYRQDWLDKLGLKAPTTVDEMFEVAKAFTEKDPDGNGKKDTYGIAGIKFGALEPAFNPNGGSVDFNIFIKDNKAYVKPLDVDAMKASLLAAKKFIDAGVVDPDFITDTSATLDTKLFQGKAGIVYGTWAQLLKDAIVAQYREINPNAVWVQGEPLKGGYNCNMDLGLGAYMGVSNTIGKTPEKLEALIDLINYVSTPDGNNLVSYGVKDKHWTASDGKIKMTEQGVKESGFTWLYQMTGRKEIEYLSTKFANQEPYIKFAADESKLEKSYTGFINAPEGFVMADALRFLEDEVIKYIYGKADIAEYDKTAKTLVDTYKVNLFLDQADKQLKELGFIK